MPGGRRATKSQVKRALSHNNPHTATTEGDFKDTSQAGQTRVQHRLPGSTQWVDWVTVKPSPLGGKGVFADRTFHTGDVIGTYCGKIIGKQSSSSVRDRVRQSHSTMIIQLGDVFVDGAHEPQSAAVQTRLAGLVVFPNGTSWPGAYVHMINSAWDMGSRRVDRDRQNCFVKESGEVEATKTIARGQELLQDYGRSYHMQMS